MERKMPEWSSKELEVLWDKIYSNSKDRYRSGYKGRGRKRRWSNYITTRPSVRFETVVRFLELAGWDVEVGEDGYVGGRMNGRVFVKGPVEYNTKTLLAMNEVNGKSWILEYGWSTTIRNLTDRLVEVYMGWDALHELCEVDRSRLTPSR